MFSLAFAYQALNLPVPDEAVFDIQLNGVSTDSRSIEPGQLFVALAGPNFDGHAFVEQALIKGAAACLVNNSYQGRHAAYLLRVDDSLRALGDLAAAWRDEQSLKVWAITGSSGKTSTKEMLALILGERYQVLKTKGNLNNFIGLPLTIFELDGSQNAAVLEMGMSWPGEIARLTSIADPDIGLITNVGPAHLENLGSLKNTARAKSELWANMSQQGVAVVNLDDPLLAPWARKFKGQVITFGLAEKAMVKALNIESHGFSQSFSLALPAGHLVRISLNAPGLHNVQNALSAAAAAFAAGLSGDEIAHGLQQYLPAAGRFRLLKAAGGLQVLDDAYNANPDSMAAGLKTMATLLHQGAAPPRRAVAILADMLELGPKAADLHRQIGVCAAQNNTSLLLAYGQQAQQMVKGAKTAGLEQAYAFSDKEELKKHISKNLTAQDIVLVKGSNSMGMTEVVEFILREFKEA